MPQFHHRKPSGFTRFLNCKQEQKESYPCLNRACKPNHEASACHVKVSCLDVDPGSCQEPNPKLPTSQERQLEPLHCPGGSALQQWRRLATAVPFADLLGFRLTIKGSSSRGTQTTTRGFRGPEPSTPKGLTPKRPQTNACKIQRHVFCVACTDGAHYFRQRKTWTFKSHERSTACSRDTKPTQTEWLSHDPASSKLGIKFVLHLCLHQRGPHENSAPSKTLRSQTCANEPTGPAKHGLFLRAWTEPMHYRSRGNRVSVNLDFIIPAVYSMELSNYVDRDSLPFFSPRSCEPFCSLQACKPCRQDRAGLD